MSTYYVIPFIWRLELTNQIYSDWRQISLSLAEGGAFIKMGPNGDGIILYLSGGV